MFLWDTIYILFYFILYLLIFLFYYIINNFITILLLCLSFFFNYKGGIWNFYKLLREENAMLTWWKHNLCPWIHESLGWIQKARKFFASVPPLIHLLVHRSILYSLSDYFDCTLHRKSMASRLLQTEKWEKKRNVN